MRLAGYSGKPYYPSPHDAKYGSDFGHKRLKLSVGSWKCRKPVNKEEGQTFLKRSVPLLNRVDIILALNFVIITYLPVGYVQ
jgi:hypothetical protein